MCMAELDVGLEKIGDLVRVAPADDSCGLVGGLLAGTEGFL